MIRPYGWIDKKKLALAVSVLAVSVSTFIPWQIGHAETLVKLDRVGMHAAVSGIAISGSQAAITGEDGSVMLLSLDTGKQTVIVKGNKADSDRVVHSGKGLAYGPDGALYVADAANNSVVKLSPDGKLLGSIGSGEEGWKDGSAAESRFHGPGDVAFGPDGSLYVADTLNHRIRKLDAKGQVTTVAGSGSETDEEGWLLGGYRDGPALTARFNEPTSIAVDKDGNLYIADTGNQRIRKLSKDGMVTTLAGSGSETVEDRYIKGGYQDGPAGQARFSSPMGVAVAANGTVYVADTWNHAIRVIAPDDTVSTLIGTGDHGKQDGWGPAALMDGPADLAIAADGMLLIADRWNYDIARIYPMAYPDSKDGTLRISLNHRPVVLTQNPVMLQNRVYVPLREVAEAAQAKVVYDSLTKKVSIQVGSSKLTPSADACMKISGKTFITARELGELLGLKVSWLSQYKLVDFER